MELEQFKQKKIQDLPQPILEIILLKSTLLDLFGNHMRVGVFNKVLSEYFWERYFYIHFLPLVDIKVLMESTNSTNYQSLVRNLYFEQRKQRHLFGPPPTYYYVEDDSTTYYYTPQNVLEYQIIVNEYSSTNPSQYYSRLLKILKLMKVKNVSLILVFEHLHDKVFDTIQTITYTTGHSNFTYFSNNYFFKTTIDSLLKLNLIQLQIDNPRYFQSNGSVYYQQLLQKNIPHLTLSSNTTTHYMPDLSYLQTTNVHTLDLNNKLEPLFSSKMVVFPVLNSVQNLKLYGFSFNTTLNNLRNLTTLKLIKVESMIKFYLPQLHTLSIKYNHGVKNFHFKLINETVCEKLSFLKCESLKNIKFQPNKILKSLFISHCEKFKLSKYIEYCINLEVLHISWTPLKSLPESILNLKKLKSLDLHLTELNELPYNIGMLTNLTFLNLDNNNLTVLPESMGNLINLTVLSLKNNKLKTLPLSFRKLKRNNTIIYLDGNSNLVIDKRLQNLNLNYSKYPDFTVWILG